MQYVVSGKDATDIMRRRTSSGSILDRMHGNPPTWPSGAQAHIGNHVSALDIYPAMIVGLNGCSGIVNLKVELDGTDCYWAENVVYDPAKGEGTWHWTQGVPT